jgi:hypothetical protein
VSKASRTRRHLIRKLIGVLFIVIGVPIFLLGIIALISPTGFLYIASYLPEEIQNIILLDIFMGTTPRSWAYIVGGFLLGGVGFFLKG